MKEKVKKVLKNRMFIFVCGGLLFSSVSVFAITYFPSNQVTYDNETSGLSSTDVQSAIDELYENCSVMTSSSKYLYFAVNNEGSSGEASGGVLYRTDLNGGNQIQIYNSSTNRISI